MKVIPLNNSCLAAWDNFVKDNPKSTIYHDPSWVQLVQDVFGYKQKGFLITDQGDIVAGLLLFEVKGLGSKRLVSNPFRDRGGILTSGKRDIMHILDKAAELFYEGRYASLLIKEEEPLIFDEIRNGWFKETTTWITTKVDLTVGTDILWKRLEDNAQGPVKQAQRYGLEFYEGASLRDMEDFYDMFLLTRKKLGIPVFSWLFFMRIWQKMCLTGKAKLLMVKKNNLPIAGMLLLLYKDTAIDGYSAWRYEYKHLRANDLLIWRSLKWSAEMGYVYFDFGADSSSQKDLLAFKRKWGGQHKAMHHYFLCNRSKKYADMNSSQPQYRLWRTIMSRLPLSVYSWISDRTVSYFG